MIILLGTGPNQMTLTTRIIDWGEVKVRPVPRKLDVGSDTPAPSIETDASVTKSRRIILTCRLTLTEKNTLYSLQAEHAWQPLTDDAVLLDYVWIEGVNVKYRKTEEKELDWWTKISCVASNV